MGDEARRRKRMISPWKLRKSRSGGCPRQMKRVASPEIVHKDYGESSNEDTFDSLNSSISILQGNACDIFEAVIGNVGDGGIVLETMAPCPGEKERGNDKHDFDVGADIESNKGSREGRTNRKRADSPPRPDSCYGLPEMIDSGLTRMVDVMFDSMSCGLDATCYEWMNVPSNDAKARKLFS